jgi:hypothetical protein
MPTYGSRVAYSLTCTRLNQSGSANNASSIYMNIYIYIYMYINHRYRYSCVSCIIYICMYINHRYRYSCISCIITKDDAVQRINGAPHATANSGSSSRQAFQSCLLYVLRIPNNRSIHQQVALCLFCLLEIYF